MKKIMFSWCLLAGACMVLTGCASRRADVASRAQTELIGMSKKELLLCAGTPGRQDKVNNLEFLTYSSSEDGGSGVGLGLSIAPALSVGVGTSTRRYCEATFVLENDLIQKITYRGRTGGPLAKDEQCAFIVDLCLKR
jgi:hypothetical protein